ncbi:hypothetical protein GRI34_04740 [Erythrobacter aquimaris]|uniref:Uncharacterized protein n=1 Tax=Qipengyuania aquimaris TaxID=255984 RepID=A0A6I4TIU1_9SPHN|nr:hypothetical protein [Qipengyuania aquimaris]
MGLRTSFGLASFTAVLLAPSVALISSLLLNGKPIIADGADNSALLFILVPSYLVTLIGFFAFGLPVTIVLDKIGGDAMVGSGIGLMAMVCLPFGLAETDFLARLAALTFIFTAGLFVLIYLSAGSRVEQNTVGSTDV